jgi:hypothetical protein
MKRKDALASGNAINSPEEKAARVQLSTRIAARFVGVGLEEPLLEQHADIGQLVPALHQSSAEETHSMKQAFIGKVSPTRSVNNPDSPSTSVSDWKGAVLKQGGVVVGRARTRGPNRNPTYGIGGMLTIFLDIDGVVHTDPCAQEKNFFIKLPLISEVLKQYDVEVVISSSWRNL